jgi:hypothetical protein
MLYIAVGAPVIKRTDALMGETPMSDDSFKKQPLEAFYRG